MKVSTAIEYFLDFLANEKRRAATTISTYATVLRDFESHLRRLNIEEIEDVTPFEVRNWQSVQMENGAAPNTVIKKITTLRSWFTYLRQKKYVDKDIMAKITTPKKPHHLPVFFRQKEAERIYSAGIFPDTFDGERDKLILRILYETGMRRSELVGLKESSVDFSNLTVKVHGKRDKQRIIPIEKELAECIRHYLSMKREVTPDEESLFVTSKGVAISANNVYVTVKKYMTSLTNADRVSPHIFRHTFATQMLNEGANINAIKELLGHASLNATEIYAHVTREHLKEVYKHSHPRAKKRNFQT